LNGGQIGTRCGTDDIQRHKGPDPGRASLGCQSKAGASSPFLISAPARFWYLSPKPDSNDKMGSALFRCMEHKGVPYQVVQTANPTGWRWTVEFDDGRTRTGTSFSRGNAIFTAIRAIEKVLVPNPPPRGRSKGLMSATWLPPPNSCGELMCDKCVEIDRTIERYRRIERTINDDLTIASVKKLIADFPRGLI
jgi:hypothetical protein